ncbi:hypothetical protein SprV_0401544700 [Sparganum proliferum]
MMMAKEICDVDGWTDYRLVISKIRLRLQPLRRPQGKRSPSKLNTALLSSPADRLHLNNQLTRRLQELSTADENASVKTRWCRLLDAVHSTALAVLGHALRQHQDWFNQNDAAISNLLAEKNGLNSAHLGLPTDAKKNVLNYPSTFSDAAIDRLPQLEINFDTNFPPYLSATIRAVQQLSSGKSSGSGAIPAEIYKHGDRRLMEQITTIFQELWCCGQAPQDFKDANIAHLCKCKVNRQVFENHKGILLFVRILFNRPNGHLEQVLLPEGQREFR